MKSHIFLPHFVSQVCFSFATPNGAQLILPALSSEMTPGRLTKTRDWTRGWLLDCWQGKHPVHCAIALALICIFLLQNKHSEVNIPSMCHSEITLGLAGVPPARFRWPSRMWGTKHKPIVRKLNANHVVWPLKPSKSNFHILEFWTDVKTFPYSLCASYVSKEWISLCLRRLEGAV